MQGQRQLELQGVIRTLESKIHSMKYQQQADEQKQQQRLQEAILREQKIIAEKDKTIATLVEEGKKSRQTNHLNHSRNIAIIEDQYRSKQENNIKLQTANLELESKVLQLTKENDFILKEKDKELMEAKHELRKLQKQRKIMIEEVQKINRFSIEATRRQPQRAQTLLWVNKLIEFMTKASLLIAQEHKDREQALLGITLHISQEIKQLNLEYSRNDTLIAGDRLKFMEEMQSMIFQVEQDCKQASRTNQEFWQGFVKVRSKEEKEYTSRLQAQLQSIRQAKDKQISELLEQINACERDKKNLLVNLQELKGYYQSREKANRQQVDYLKKTVEDLIISQEARERESEKQLEKMQEQIKNLTVSFYEKVELPINTVYSKIKQEVSRFQDRYSIFFEDPVMQEMIQELQRNIVGYLVKLNEQKDLRECVKEAAGQVDKIANFLTHNYQVPQREIIHKQENNLSFSFNSSVNQEGKEHEKKLLYELATARRYIEKLKEHNRMLEGKQPNRATTALVNSKMLELAAQNQALKDHISLLQRQKNNRITQSEQILNESRLGKINTALLEQIIIKSEEILKFVMSQQQYLLRLSKCVNSLNTVFLSPAQTFQNLLDQIKNISGVSIPNPVKQIPKQPVSLDDLKAKRLVYKEIISRKSQAGINIQKSNIDLAKVIREVLTLSKSTTLRMDKSAEIVAEADKPKFSESRQMLEKRVKQTHNMRIKAREEMLEKLVYLEQKIKNIENKASRKQSFPFIKFEESICKKLNDLFTSLMPKDKFKELKKISQQALSDAASKLKECQIENEGLLKEIDLLKNTKPQS